MFYLEKKTATWTCCFPSITHSRPLGKAGHGWFLLLFRSYRKELGSPSCCPYDRLCRSCRWGLHKCALLHAAAGEGPVKRGGIWQRREQVGKQSCKDKHPSLRRASESFLHSFHPQFWSLRQMRSRGISRSEWQVVLRSQWQFLSTIWISLNHKSQGQA